MDDRSLPLTSMMDENNPASTGNRNIYATSEVYSGNATYSPDKTQ